MHNVPVAQELSSISDTCMVREVSTSGGSNCQRNWGIAVYVMEGSKLMDRSSTTRRKACLSSKVVGEEACLN